MGVPLAPPSVHAIDGVIYTFRSPIESHRPGWAAAAGLLVLLFSGGSLFGLAFMGMILAAVGWAVDRTVQLVVGLHRLEIRTTRLGLFAHTIALPWHDLREAVLDGQEILVQRRDHRAEIRVSAWAPVAQLAWVVGAVNAQIRRVATPQLPEQTAFDLARLDELVVTSQQRR
jgi:hypothetical protein